MAGEQGDSLWPMPKFYFSVDIPHVGSNIAFQEVTGLEAETEPIEYRAGNSKVFTPIKMPGNAEIQNVVLKKGILVNDNKFYAWYSQISMNTVKRQAITIKLLDETGKPAMTWTLTNAWPTKISATDLMSDGNEVAIETLELAHSGLTINNG